MPRPIIIDTDPGIDDAVAILLALASPEIEVLGLVAVAGNLPLAATARNALSIAELAGHPELPVYAGCPRPLGRPRIDAEGAHGAGGLGDLVLPPPAAVLRPEHGILYLIDRLREAAPKSITLCALGPHLLGRLRQDQIAETARAMRPFGIQPVRADRPRTPGIDADVGAAGEFDEGAGVARGRGERHVAGDRHQPQHLELGRGQCQQDGDGVVNPGIGVDDDRARHG